MHAWIRIFLKGTNVNPLQSTKAIKYPWNLDLEAVVGYQGQLSRAPRSTSNLLRGYQGYLVPRMLCMKTLQLGHQGQLPRAPWQWPWWLCTYFQPWFWLYTKCGFPSKINVCRTCGWHKARQEKQFHDRMDGHILNLFVAVWILYSLYSFEIRRDVTSGRLRISGEVPWNALIVIWNCDKTHAFYGYSQWST